MICSKLSDWLRMLKGNPLIISMASRLSPKRFELLSEKFVVIRNIASGSSDLNSVHVSIEIGCNVADYTRSVQEKQLETGVEHTMVLIDPQSAFAAASSRTSTFTGFTRLPYCATRGASSSVRRAPATTLSPAANAASAMSRPNPFPLPVMNQTLDMKILRSPS
jgi:hypothetical protein